MSTKCISPFVPKTKKGITHAVPCGKCYNCRKRNASTWGIRIMHELKNADYPAYFVTLTYDTENVPIVKDGMTLDKTDLQKWFKRVRKAMQKYNKIADKVNAWKYNKSVKYFAVGEYGGKTDRPHYHIILFNAEINLAVNAWTKGTYFVGTVNEASIQYTLKYMMKKGRFPKYIGDQRRPEFQLMSKGVGRSYLTPAVITWHHQELADRVYIQLENKKMPMARYYKDIIYNTIQKIEIKTKKSDKGR